MRRFARPHLEACTCGDCARLDLDFPGEGLQLRLPLNPPPAFAGTPTSSAQRELA
jgi:hypothetical protein